MRQENVANRSFSTQAFKDQCLTRELNGKFMINFIQPIQSKNPFIDDGLTFDFTSQASSDNNIGPVFWRAVVQDIELQEQSEFNPFSFDLSLQKEDAIWASLDGTDVEEVAQQHFEDSQKKEHGLVEGGPFHSILNRQPIENPDRLEHSHVESDQLLSMDCELIFQQRTIASDASRLSDSSKIADSNSMGSLPHAPIPRGQLMPLQPEKKKTRIACGHCYKGKRKCDASRPCERCQKTRKLVCKDRIIVKRNAEAINNTRERKKVTRACSNCLSAKRACDSNRPCGRCIRVDKKESCKDRPLKATNNTYKRRNVTKVCSNCLSAKTACDSNRPCGRCIRVDKKESCKDRPPSAREIKKIACREIKKIACREIKKIAWFLK